MTLIILSNKQKSQLPVCPLTSRHLWNTVLKTPALTLERGYKAVKAQPCLFLQRMLTPAWFFYSQIAVLNYGCRERLLFLMGADWWEVTKEAVVSRRLQTPVVLRAVNTSLFTAGNGAHLDLSCPCLPGTWQKPLTITSWAQLKGLLNYNSLRNSYRNLLQHWKKPVGWSWFLQRRQPVLMEHNVVFVEKC